MKAFDLYDYLGGKNIWGMEIILEDKENINTEQSQKYKGKVWQPPHSSV